MCVWYFLLYHNHKYRYAVATWINWCVDLVACLFFHPSLDTSVVRVTRIDSFSIFHTHTRRMHPSCICASFQHLILAFRAAWRHRISPQLQCSYIDFQSPSNYFGTRPITQVPHLCVWPRLLTSPSLLMSVHFVDIKLVYFWLVFFFSSSYFGMQNVFVRPPHTVVKQTTSAGRSPISRLLLLYCDWKDLSPSIHNSSTSCIDYIHTRNSKYFLLGVSNNHYKWGFFHIWTIWHRWDDLFGGKRYFNV